MWPASVSTLGTSLGWAMLQHLAEVQVAGPPPERYHLTFVITKGDELPNVKDILQGENIGERGFPALHRYFT